VGALGKIDTLEAPLSQDPRAHSKLNLATTVVGFLVSICTGLWFTPFLVHKLGPAAYGIIPLATTVVSYFSLLTQTLSSALNRSISVSLAGGDMARAGRAFSSALGGVLLIIVLLVPPIAALSWAAPALFNVPPGEALATRALFAIVGTTLLFSLLSTPYLAIAFGQNKIYWNNLTSLIQTATRIGLTVLLFSFAANIFNAGIAILVAALGSVLLGILSARLNARTLAIFRPSFHREELRALSRTSSHVLLMQLGTVLTMSCEVVIANKLFGAYQSGRYAAAIQWLLLLRNANMALVVLCVPTILRLVGEHKHDELIVYTRQAMTWSALFIALPAGFVCGVSPQLLTAWLGPHFTDMWPIVVVQLIPMVFTCTVLPLYSISLGTDKMLVGGIAQLALGTVGVGIALLLGWQWGMIGVAIGVNWSFGIKELLFTPAYAAHNIGAPRRTFLAPLGTVGGLFCVAAGLSWAGAHAFAPHSMIQLFFLGVGVSVVYAGISLVAFRSLIMGAISTLFAKRGRAGGPAVQQG